LFGIADRCGKCRIGRRHDAVGNGELPQTIARSALCVLAPSRQVEQRSVIIDWLLALGASNVDSAGSPDDVRRIHRREDPQHRDLLAFNLAHLAHEGRKRIDLRPQNAAEMRLQIDLARLRPALDGSIVGDTK
jgi:hypothetical protein